MPPCAHAPFVVTHLLEQAATTEAHCEITTEMRQNLNLVKEGIMKGKKYTAERIVAKLGEAEVLLGSGMALACAPLLPFRLPSHTVIVRTQIRGAAKATTTPSAICRI